MIAVYYRVSTNKQEYDSQKAEIEKYLKSLGNPKHVIYEEKISSRKHRPAYQMLLAEAKKGTYEQVVSYAFDRFGRDGKQSLMDKWKLEELGIEVIFASQGYLNKTNDDGINLILDAITAYQAQKERDHISNRVKAGLEAAKQRGVKLGRPFVDTDIKIAVKAQIDQGIKIAEIAHRNGISERTVYRIKKNA